MIFIWFIYGLAFFTLGLVIIIYPKKGSVFRLANHIWLIAGFGILHGINEWLDMFIVLGEPFQPKVLKLIRIVTLSGSFLFLLRFGTRIVAESRRKYRPLQALPMILFIPWVIILATSPQRLLMGDVWARYLLCAPGASLTALGLFLQIPQFKETKLQAAMRNLCLTAIVFLFYTVFAGLIVKGAAFFPANYFNYDLFRDTFGVPVQVFRALCAAVLAYSTARLLSIFRWETQEALRRSEQRCSTIASAMPMILFVQDLDSVITFIQGKGLDLLGLTPAEIIGKRISEVFPSVPQLDEDRRRALSGEEFITNVRINGVVFESCYSPLRDNEGEVVGVIGVAFDVTVRVKVQEQLDRYRREIEKNARLAEIGTMSSIMAQQLDEPLTVTRLLLQRLAGDLGEASTPEEVISSVKKGLAEVSKAVDIVDRSRSVAQVPGRSIIAPVDIYQIAKRVTTVFAQSAKHANLNIAVKNMDLVPVMSLNSRELEQIFFIMIQNAIDAADANKRQSLNISCKATAKEIELQFADTCGGIEPEKLQHIFEPFRAKELGVKDAGLSLAIAKQIICAHGGKIVAESKPGRGTTFYVRLPVEHVH
ncbi:MAG: two-component system sensor histidine kinase NtrB [Planctomycetota bacterium]|jgi:PAS domain S-box-containing protein